MSKKNAVVTGASYGLGAEICRKLIDDGYHVYGLSRSKPPESLMRFPENFTWIECDISKYDEVKLAFKQIDQHTDILVNNAGVFTGGKFAAQNYEAIDKVIDVNVKGAMYVTNEAIKWMPSYSRIFFINSVSGLYEIEHEAIYGASKHALTAFAGVLGKELQSRAIRVTSIHPGSIETPMQRTNPNNIPGMFMKPEEIANLISFICKTEFVEYKTIKMFPSTEWHL
jgi:NAD(P)-dependent dehydrogenase (short-subunit alcohol dehydrogenase family)